uniref:laminin subunit alpha-4-like n=1 Tax=Podarcis muralis TaxID=64176 RepID=UPI00109F90EF|nr:laminin subunit alpha-4-like [Podarcis muralis]
MLRDMSCHLPKHPQAFKNAFQFGASPGSHLEFDDIPATFHQRFHFSMEVRLNSSNGLLFYMANESLGFFFSLFVSSGRFVLLADISGRKLRVRSKEKYHDGRWHTVFYSRDRSRVQLIINGLRAQEKSLPVAGDFWIPGPFYVGGAPVEKAKAHIPDASATSFKGCIRHLKLDRKPLVSPSRLFGVTPCYEGPLESGTFFSADGGYVALDRSVAIGQDFELMLEIRPRSVSGLIFHIGTRQTNYLSLYTDKEKVTVIANTGAGEFATSVTQPSLCDGQWHTLAVIKSSNVIQLDVDTEGNYIVGPNQAHAEAIKENFYLGGMPELEDTGLPLAPVAHLPSYIGCMKNLVINRNQINLREAGTVRGAVGLTECPLM